MSSIRRKRRQRGKAKALRKEALTTWERLNHVAAKPKTKSLESIIPLIRVVTPNMIAQEIVSVQPMQAPAGMFHDTSNGVESILKERHDIKEKKTPQQRKKERGIKARERKFMEKVNRQLTAPNKTS